jgi:hypothetical protein
MHSALRVQTPEAQRVLDQIRRRAQFISSISSSQCERRQNSCAARFPHAQRARSRGGDTFSQLRRFVMGDSKKGWAAIGMAARSVALNGASQRTAAHQQSGFGKTNPTRRACQSPPSDASILAEIMACNIDNPVMAKSRTTALHGASQRTAAHQFRTVEKTNPTASSLPPLTSRQLAAARLVVRGMSSADVATRLKTIRQTINRWKKLPQFDAEVRRLHELLLVGEKM